MLLTGDELLKSNFGTGLWRPIAQYPRSIKARILYSLNIVNKYYSHEKTVVSWLTQGVLFAVGSLAWNNMNFDTEVSNKYKRHKKELNWAHEAEYQHRTSGSPILQSLWNNSQYFAECANCMSKFYRRYYNLHPTLWVCFPLSLRPSLFLACKCPYRFILSRSNNTYCCHPPKPTNFLQECEHIFIIKDIKIYFYGSLI